MNSCIFLGRLTRDPESRTVGDTTVTEFSIAVGRKYKTNGETKEEVNFLDMVAWDKGGETIAKFFKKGEPILVRASAKQDSWKDKESGAPRSRVVFRVENFEFLPANGKKENSGESESAVSTPVGNVDGVPAQDEIPF